MRPKRLIVCLGMATKWDERAVRRDGPLRNDGKRWMDFAVKVSVNIRDSKLARSEILIYCVRDVYQCDHDHASV